MYIAIIMSYKFHYALNRLGGVTVTMLASEGIVGSKASQNQRPKNRWCHEQRLVALKAEQCVQIEWTAFLLASIFEKFGSLRRSSTNQG